METARYRAVLELYRTACPLTRPYYNLGVYYDGPNEENWAIQWILWHSFRLTRPLGPPPEESVLQSTEEEDASIVDRADSGLSMLRRYNEAHTPHSSSSGSSGMWLKSCSCLCSSADS